MMLCFAEKRGELAEILNRKIFECENDLDTICQILSMGKDNYRTVSNPTGDGCVLPIDFFNEATRARINILCNDLITLFKLPIPTPDIIKHVARLLSLNLLCYFLEQSREAIKAFSTDSRVLPCIMPCEILTKESTDVRRISRAFFEKHRQMSLDAVRLYYEHYVGKEPIDSLNEDDDQKSASKKSSGATLEDILKNHRRHWGANLHRFLGKDCGLATNINAKSFRYAPSDSLIETLAAVIVPVGRKRLLLSDFLELAYKRYNLVFGEKEFSAAGIVDKSLVPDSSELDANRFRLQAKLSSLGLLVALSDGFEFVLNPYHA